jgi:diguanylate cyclase (GGDEF)-like protein
MRWLQISKRSFSQKTDKQFWPKTATGPCDSPVMRSSLASSQIIPSYVTRITTTFAMIISIAVSVFPPALHFYYEAQSATATIRAEAKLQSRLLSQIIGQNPQLWQFETLRITELVTPDAPNESVTVYDLDGVEVTQAGRGSPGLANVTISLPLYDSGMKAGEIHIVANLSESLQHSLAILLVSSLAAFGVFLALRILPLRLLKMASDHASFLASHDPLTRLPNRALFNEWLERSLSDAEGGSTPLAVLCLDLDHFKEVNDFLGHSAGDELLRQVTERMKKSLRNSDILARLGGDEFAIIQKGVVQPSASSVLAERLVESLSEPFILDGHEIVIGVSIGVSICARGDEADAQMMMRHADLAMYRAKNDGRGAFRFFEDRMNDALVARKKLETNLRTAIAESEFELYYQPQIDLTTDTIKGVEALLRWNHKGKGFIPPDKFIPLAEETGLIIPIGAWVIREACRQAKDWPELTFAVNVSPVQFRQGDLVETVREALQTEGIDPRRLEIEITEGVLLSHTEETIAVLTALQGMGVRIAMDDFGTGYSSLSYLRRFPFDKVKIDKSFTSDLGTRVDADNIVEAVIKLAASMGMTSNAEGVETKEQSALLKFQGCDEVQGYHFSTPVPSVLISELLATQKRRDDEAGISKPVITSFARQA